LNRKLRILASVKYSDSGGSNTCEKIQRRNAQGVSLLCARRHCQAWGAIASFRRKGTVLTQFSQQGRH